MSTERQAREVIKADGDIPQHLREAHPDLFSKPLSQAARAGRLECARKQLSLAEVRREMGLADDEREPDPKLIYEVSDLFESGSSDALRRWFRLRLEGKLSTEDAQVLAGVKLRNPSIDPEVMAAEVDRILRKRAQGPFLTGDSPRDAPLP